MHCSYLYFCCQDFGDGGAYPEIHVAQFPMGLGQQQSKGGTSNALAKQVDADGKIKYDVIARYGHAQDKVSHSGFTVQLFVKSTFGVNLIGTGNILSDVYQDARVIS